LKQIAGPIIGSLSMEVTTCGCDRASGFQFGADNCYMPSCQVFNGMLLVFFAAFFVFTTAELIIYIKKNAYHSDTRFKRFLHPNVIVLYLLDGFLLLRVIRYSISQSTTFNREATKPIATGVGVLLLIGTGVLLSGYNLLIYVWFITYQFFLSKIDKGKLSYTKTQDARRKQFIWLYITINVIIFLVIMCMLFIDLFVLQNLSFILTLVWIGLVFTAEAIGILVYGGRVAKAVDGHQARHMKSMYPFIRVASALFILLFVMVLLALVGEVVAKTHTSYTFYLVRNSVFRFIELLLIYAMVRALSPPIWRLCFNSLRSTNSDVSMPSEMENTRNSPDDSPNLIPNPHSSNL